MNHLVPKVLKSYLIQHFIKFCLGWGAMAVGIAGGILGVCASWSAMSEDDGADDYNMGYDKGPAYDAGRPNGYV